MAEHFEGFLFVFLCLLSWQDRKPLIRLFLNDAACAMRIFFFFNLCSPNKWPFHEVSFHFSFFFPAPQYIPQRAYSSAGYWLMVVLCVPFNFAINQQGVETTNLKRIDLFIWLDSLERQADLVISVWSWGGQEESVRRNTVVNNQTEKSLLALPFQSSWASILSSDPFPDLGGSRKSSTRLAHSSRILNSVGL